MTFLDDLDQLVSRAHGLLTNLEQLTQQKYADVLVAGDEDTTPPQIASDKTWTLKQTTPNTPDNKYKGVYKLPQSTTNSRLTNLSLVAPANPTDITAQVRPAATASDPNPAFGAEQSIASLEGECVNAITLVSVGPFELRLNVGECVWCYDFNFTTNDGGWSNVTPNGRGTYLTGQGWRGTGGGQPTERIVIEKTFSTLRITEIEATIYNDATTSNHNELWFNGTIRASNNNTGSQILTWNGSENGSSVRLDLEGNPNAVAYISRVIIRGAGDSPFGSTNCP